MSDVREAIFEGARPIAAWPGDARATAYGDGLFETMRVHRGAVPWGDAHRARLLEGARRLSMRVPARKWVDAAARTLFDDGGDGVLKLIVSRGGGGRGYAPLAAATPVWRVSRHPLSAPARAGGLVLRWCEMRLSVQPALAGLKHLNRLEHVLARAEWDDPGIDEGLLRDIDGHVVGATAANLFVLHGDRWTTPPVDRCGVAGVCRAFAMQATGAREARLSEADVRNADAVALCNAVRGILPVARLDARAWALHPALAGLQRDLARMHPAFPSPQEFA